MIHILLYKKKDFLPKNNQIWPKIGIFGQFWPGNAGLFDALLVGRLVVVARGLYLARHLFTLLLLLGGRESPKLESWLSDPRLLETPHPKTYSLPVAKLLQNFQDVFTFV